MIPDEWLDFYDMVDKVQELLDLGLTNEAREILDKYQSTSQEYWEYYFLYSRLLTDENKPEEAIACLMTGLHIERDNVDCMLGLFYAYSMIDQVKRGGRFLRLAEKLEPDNELVLSALIWYYTEINEPETAVKYFERAQDVHSNNPDTYRNAGIMFDRLGRFEEAEACYKAALMISPSFEDARDLYADHLIFTGKPEAAAKIYEEALQSSPQNVRFISKLIYCLSQAGDFEKAEALAKQSIVLYPNTPLGYVDLAYVYLNTCNYDDAIATADKAITVSPIDAEGYRVKAISCSENGNFEEAEKLFNVAISFDPDNPDILRDYYRHLRIAGNDELMLETIERVIDLEEPYCAEDYWFLADYYRDCKQDLEAFRYLRLAYKSIPRELELLPPMLDILLERGHVKFSLPLLTLYAQKKNWTDSMERLSAHKKFRSRNMQEGMRFLRYACLHPVKYRTYIFNRELIRFGLMYYTLFAAALMFPLFVLFKWHGVFMTAVVYALSIAAIKVAGMVKRKIAIARTKNDALSQFAKGNA